nr:alpha/beta hydrolase [Rhodococcus sp. (in: high G+C Gram-positive bacteria)]
MARLLFIHGAGGFAEDGVLAHRLGEALGSAVEMPEFSDEDMSFEGWAVPLRSLLAASGGKDILVAHSFGASILVRVLAENRHSVTRATLLAMPDWTADGWDVPDYAFLGAEPPVELTLHHCRDDEVVPFDHLALNASRFPAARVREYPSGGHQFDGVVREIASDIRGML